jgi:hypothetical protein
MFMHRHCEPQGRGNLFWMILYEIASLHSQ